MLHKSFYICYTFLLLKTAENERIKGKIAEIYEYSKKRYGCIKIKHVLEKYNIYISQNRVLRLMRQMGIKSVICPKYRHNRRSADKSVSG